MYTPAVRLVFILGCLGYGAYLLMQERYLAAGCFLAAAALLTYGYFRSGTVWLAVRAYQAGQTERAEALLNQISHPDLLRSQDRAYYEMLRDCEPPSATTGQPRRGI